MGIMAFCVVNYFILLASKRGGYIEKILKNKIEEKSTNEQKSQSKSRN